MIGTQPEPAPSFAVNLLGVEKSPELVYIFTDAFLRDDNHEPDIRSQPHAPA